MSHQPRPQGFSLKKWDEVDVTFMTLSQVKIQAYIY